MQKSQAEQHLDMNIDERNLAALVNYTDDLIWSVNNNYELISANEAFSKMLVALTGKSLAPGDQSLNEDSFPPEILKHWKALYDRALAGERFSIETYTPPMNNAEESWSNTKFSPITFNDQIIGLVANSRNITENKKHQLELEKLNNKLERAQSIAKIGYWELDLDRNEVYWSGETYRIWGVTPDTFTTNFENFIETVHPEDRARFLANQAPAFAGQGELDIEHRIILPDGSIKHVYEKGWLVKDEAGRSLRFEGTVQDITEQKKAADALRLSNERFRYVTQATYDAIWDYDVATGHIYWGDGYEQLFGYKSEQANNLSNWIEHIHPEDVNDVTKSVADAMSSSSPKWEMEYRYYKAEGTIAYVQDRCIIIRNNAGEATRLIGAMQDITTQKLREQQLTLMESVITNTTDSVTITNAPTAENSALSIVYVNNAFTRLTGYSKEEVLGNSPRILNGPLTDLTEFARLTARLPAFDQCELELLKYKKNGEQFWVNLTVVPVTNKEGVTTHWIGIDRDITARKKEALEKELLFQLIKTLGQLSLPDAWSVILEKIATHCGFGFGKVWMVNIDESAIILTNMWTNIPDRTVNSFKHCIPRIKKGDGLVGNTWASKKIRFVNDMGADPTFLVGDFVEVMNVHSAVLVPIILNNEVIALFSFYARSTEIKPDQCLRLFENISQQLGPHIQRKKIEDELSRFFNLSPDFLCIAAKDGLLKKTNHSFTKLLNYSEQELLATPVVDFTHKDDENFIDAVLSCKSSSPLYLENRLLTKDGAEIWVAWTVIIETAADDSLIYAVGKDISDKMKLHEERTHILESLSDCFCILDKNYNYSYANKAAEELLKVEHGSLIGKNIWEEYPVLKNSVFYDNMLYANKTQQPVNFEFYSDVLDFWFEENLYPSKDSMSIFFKPINDRKKTEEAIQNSFNEKNSILESITDGFISLNKDWTVNYWNKEAEKMLGVIKAEIVGKNLLDFFQDRLPLKFYTEINRSLDENISVNFEEFLNRKNIWVEISAYPSEIGLSIYIKDVSDRKNAERVLNELHYELEKRAEALIQTNSELERFAYVASHDLQEPLRMVTSFLQLLQKKYKDSFDETGNKYIYFAVDGAERMKRLINDLLQYSRIGTSELLVEKVDMNEIVGETAHIFTSNGKNADASIIYKDLPIVDAASVPMAQLMQNLIGNSLKYRSAAPPVIHITCRDTPKEWIFCVSDNGIGISKQFWEKIFVVFQRLHNKDEYSGTGIGLAICKKIVERFHGKIWVESEAGQGSKFTFTLPKKINQIHER